MMAKAFITLTILAIASSADPSCAYIKAQPQYMHPGVPQEAAEAKCSGDCAQPGYNCEMIANYYPAICTCGSSPSTPSPTPAPPAPAPRTCTNPAYHQCGGNDGFSGDTCCPFYQGVQQICHRESDQYWQCCPPDLHGCGAAFWIPFKNPKADKPAVQELAYVGKACTGASSGLNQVTCAAWQDLAQATNITGWTYWSDIDNLLDPCGMHKHPVTCADGDITKIYLNGNNLKGTLPSSLGSLTKLTIMALNDNSLEGTIPSSLGSLTELIDIRLGCNSLTGQVPPLPFKQYIHDCGLGSDRCGGGKKIQHNHFKCPLPAGSEHCGIHC
jgi:hypothetical protein